MFKIDTSNAAIELPTPGPTGPHPNGFFSNGDFSGTTSDDLPTQVSHDFLNAIQEEICYVIEQQAISLDKNDRTQLYTAIYSMASGTGPSPGVLFHVQDDTSPELGGDLEVNGNKIFSASGDITIEALLGIITLNASILRVGTDIAHHGDTNNKITFGTDTQTFVNNGSPILDITTSGFRVGGANQRITSIDNDTSLTADSSTLLATQHAAKAYIDAVVPGSGVITEFFYHWAGSSDINIVGTTNTRITCNGPFIVDPANPTPNDGNLLAPLSAAALIGGGIPPLGLTTIDCTIIVNIDVAPGVGNSWTFNDGALNPLFTISGTATQGTVTIVANPGGVNNYFILTKTGSPAAISKISATFMYRIY